MTRECFFEIVDDGEQIEIMACGRWTSTNAGKLNRKLSEIITGLDSDKAVTIVLAKLQAFDTYGALILNRTKMELEKLGIKIRISDASAENITLYNSITKTDDEDGGTETGIKSWTKFFSLYEVTVGTAKSLAEFLSMFGAIIAATIRIASNPRKLRATSTIHHMDVGGWQALPIVLLVTFIIGAILAQQGFFHFRKFGTELYVVDMVGFLIMRELGLLLVAIIVAGRSGSACTAELGSMKMREEIDALKTMGFNPVDVLVLPRVWMLVIIVPMLTFVGCLSALSGAALVAVIYGDMSLVLFLDRLREAITLDHVLVGQIKAPFLGLAIGVIACTESNRVKGSTGSLGDHTTQSVVKSIFTVILLDGMFALFFSGINM